MKEKIGQLLQRIDYDELGRISVDSSKLNLVYAAAYICAAGVFFLFAKRAVDTQTIRRRVFSGLVVWCTLLALAFLARGIQLLIQPSG